MHGGGAHRNEASLSSSPGGGAVGVAETGTVVEFSLMNKSPLAAARRKMSGRGMEQTARWSRPTVLSVLRFTFPPTAGPQTEARGVKSWNQDMKREPTCWLVGPRELKKSVMLLAGRSTQVDQHRFGRDVGDRKQSDSATE